ncbi:MAG: ComEC/Rec2 family competence protein [Parvularculaceae bacterium]
MTIDAADERSPLESFFTALSDRASALRAKARDWAREEAGRGALWAPAGIGLGVGVYFSLKTEPALWAGPMLLILFVALSRLSQRAGFVLRALMLAALGFSAAAFRTEMVGAPALERDLGIVAVEGRLAGVEEGPQARRLVIAVDAIEDVAKERLPVRARVTWRGAQFNANPGDRVRLIAGLSPPPPPAAPASYDFARQLFFERIGAVGFAVRAPEVLPTEDKSLTERWSARVEAARLSLFRRITRAAPGDGGAIVAAVVAGKREAISPSAEAALRDAGLAHLLAISGLHMGLATGIIFFSVRFGLALIEPVALRYPIKKWAAIAALLAGAAYLVLSGAGWSARRAFVMAAIMFAAILADRRALSLRNVAIAAAFILLTTPEALLHPGFQMSFAAVTALIAAYEWASRRRPPREFTTLARVKRYALGLAFTDVIAATATAPYALYHFNRAAFYSLPANLVAMPVMGFWIMPAAVLALALAPFGADAWAWRLAASGVETVLAVAGAVSNWPGAVGLTAQWPVSALVIVSLGGLWLCLMRASWRLGGLAALPAAALLVSTARPPDAFVSAEGLNAGVIAETTQGERVLAVFNPRRDRFDAGVWKEIAGLDPDRAPSVAMDRLGACDAAGCVMTGRGGAMIAVSDTPLGLAEDCDRAGLVVALYPVRAADWRACRATLIDRRAVWRRGAHALWFEKDGTVRVKTVGESRGNRPWTGGG